VFFVSSVVESLISYVAKKNMMIMMIKKLLVAMLLMPLMLFGGDVVDDDKPMRVYVDMIADLFHGAYMSI